MTASVPGHPSEGPHPEEVSRYLEDIEPGDHLAVIFEEDEDHKAVVTQFVRDGLEADERVVYVVDEHTAEEVREHLRTEGIDVEAAEATEQLQVITSEASYTRGGSFSPTAMIEFLTEASDRALADGFEGLRATGEMSWALSSLDDLDILFEYEAMLNQFIEENPAVILCQYDRRRFTPEDLLRVVDTHPLLAVGNQLYENFYYVPPDEYLAGRGPEVTLNHRLGNLKTRRHLEHALRDSRDEFEARVEERTQELKEYADRLEQANADLESYAHLVAHDLQEPVRIAHTHVELLQERLDGDLGDDGDEIMETIRQALRSMRSLISETLTYAELDRQERPLEAVDAGDVVERVLVELADPIEETNARIEVGDLPEIEADPRQLRLVFYHLIENAIQYTTEGAPEIQVTGEETPDGWRFAVTDEGEGIPQRHQDEIFEPLFRLHGPGDLPGSGMGLPTCRQIVRRHGGSMEVDSAPGEGSTFVFTIGKPDGTDQARARLKRSWAEG